MAKVAAQTPQQLRIVLGDIAKNAKTIHRLALMLTERDETDDRDVEAQRHAIETLAELIGLLADWSNGSIAFQENGGNVEDWLMPPVWHPQDPEKQEAQHG